MNKIKKKNSGNFNDWKYLSLDLKSNKNIFKLKGNVYVIINNNVINDDK